MEFEKFIDGKFKTSTLPYIALNNFLLPGCDLGQVIIFFCFNGVQPWARHFY
jgi:hypothetical protein